MLSDVGDDCVSDSGCKRWLVMMYFEDGLEGKSMSDTIMMSEGALEFDITMQQIFTRLC